MPKPKVQKNKSSNKDRKKSLLSKLRYNVDKVKRIVKKSKDLMEENRSIVTKGQLDVINNVIGSLDRHQSDYLREREDNEDKTGWLDILPCELLNSLSLLVEKLDNWINPFIRGSQGMGGAIFVDVKDKDMEQFISRIGEVKEWKLKKRTTTLKTDPHTAGVQHYKWSTTYKALVKSLLGRFYTSSPNMAKYYIKKEQEEDPTFIVISENAASHLNSVRLGKLSKSAGWNYYQSDINVYSCKVLFGNYTRPGTITSDCVQKANGTKKTRDTIGHFSIHYYKGVYPNSKMGWLKISCKYFTSLISV